MSLKVYLLSMACGISAGALMVLPVVLDSSRWWLAFSIPVGLAAAAYGYMVITVRYIWEPDLWRERAEEQRRKREVKP